LGPGTWLDLLRGALVAHLHPLAADRDAIRGPTMITRPAIARHLTRWVPLVAVFAAATVFIDFWFGRADDWKVWLPPGFIQELLRSPFSNISPTMAEAEALEGPRVLYFAHLVEGLDDFTLHLGMLVFAFAAALMWAVVARRLTPRSRPV
jgi:hypothetical protein